MVDLKREREVEGEEKGEIEHTISEITVVIPPIDRP